MTDPVTSTVDYASADGLGVIRLNRPQARNAIDPAFVDDLNEAVQRCAADETLRALLIRAEGPSFTVGGDVAGFGGLGLSGDGGGTWFLPRLVGMRRAAELYFRQRVLQADEAAAWGLITRVVRDKDLTAEAESAARQLAAGPTRALGEIRTLLRRSPDASLADQLLAETAAQSRTVATRDAAHGIECFMTKSRPDFRGW